MGFFVLKNKKEIITVIFMILCLAGYVFFPATGDFQYKIVAIVFLALLPFLYGKYFLKEKNIFKRIKVGDWRNNLKWLAISLTFAFLIVFILFSFTNLLMHYFLPTEVKNDFGRFLLYEFTGVAFVVATYELFFRGFVMFHFATFLKKWSILVQMLFFIVMISMLFNLPYWFYVTYLIFTPFAGWVAYKSDSLLYSFFGQLLFVIIVDASYIAIMTK